MDLREEGFLGLGFRRLGFRVFEVQRALSRDPPTAHAQSKIVVGIIPNITSKLPSRALSVYPKSPTSLN